MGRTITHAGLFAAALAIGSCSFVSDNLFPSFDDPAAPPDDQPVVEGSAQGTAPAGGGTSQPQGQQAPKAAPGQPPQTGTSTSAAPEATPGNPTATVVGAKVQQIRNEFTELQSRTNEHTTQLQELRRRVQEHAEGYHGTVATINSRLQVGTTHGNPELISQWNNAHTQLDGISRDITAMSAMANEVASDAATAKYLSQTARATYGLSGAVEEDHRQLAVLEEEIGRTTVQVDRLMNEVTEDITRQSAYVGQERQKLTALAMAIKDGGLTGQSLASRSPVSGLQGPMAGGGAAAAEPAGDSRPLVVIRFDRPNVDYEQALYSAVSQALERHPRASFDVVAVAPSQGSATEVAQGANAARRNAEDVLRSLTSMGLPPSRVNLSAGTSGQAQTAEVHLYVR